MESISNILKKRGDLRIKFEALSAKILDNPEISSFIKEYKLTDDQIVRSYSKFYEYLTEKERTKESMNSYIPVLTLNEGYADVCYKETATFRLQREARMQVRRVELVGLPKALRTIDWGQVQTDTNYNSQAVLYKLVVDFVQYFPKNKGIYIYGKFGIGKSFLMAAMANSLSKKNISTILLHYPTFISETDYDNVRERVNHVKTAQVLVLDDIGAETNSSWVRDSVLQVILQHRMDNNLSTFFTSNFSMTELEQHFAETRNERDIWPAQRVMERIKFLAKEVFMEGENRRYDK